MKPDDDIDPAEVPDRIAAGAPEDHDEESHGIPLKWFLATVAFAVIAIALSGWIGQRAADSADHNQAQAQAAQSTATAAAKQANDLASQVQAACKASGSAHDALTKLGVCQQANAVKSTPAAKTSKPPRRVSSVAIVNQSLVVSYNDGTSANLGTVVGKSGSTGPAGKATTGKTGEPGQPGKDATGKAGTNGVGIVSALPNAAGHLIVTYTDGKTTDAGKVVGPAGSDGKNGDPGVSVVGVSVSASYHLLVTLSNGNVTDAGQLPPGPKGDKGDSVTGPAGPKGDPGQSVTGPPGKDGSDGKNAPTITGSSCTDGVLVFELSNGDDIKSDAACTKATTPPTDPPTSPDPTSTAP